MRWWRRFFLWLAEEDLKIAHDLGRNMEALLTEQKVNVARAEGEIAGYRSALQYLQNLVDARTHALDEAATAEDIERARKGQLH